MNRKPYPTDVTDEEWHFVAPYLALIDGRSPQRRYDLREVFSALCWLARAGAPWRLLPSDFPPWAAIYQQFRRWNEAGCFEAMVCDFERMPEVLAGLHFVVFAILMLPRTAALWAAGAGS